MVETDSTVYLRSVTVDRVVRVRDLPSYVFQVPDYKVPDYSLVPSEIVVWYVVWYLTRLRSMVVVKMFEHWSNSIHNTGTRLCPYTVLNAYSYFFRTSSRYQPIVWYLPKYQTIVWYLV